MDWGYAEMLFNKDQFRPDMAAVLSALRRNKSGNTIAIVAAGLVPMTAMVGSGVDISRSYMVQTRLQQACDAGVLAGRRAVGDGEFDDNATDIANDFFNVNFPNGYLETEDLSFTATPGNGDSTVNGVASVTMPTVIMNLFMIDDLDITVNCRAQLEIANSDITFVLDTTGSMACPEDANTAECDTYFATNGTNEGISMGSLSTTSRLGALRDSLDSFYNIVQGAATSSNARIRYSFVPYSQTVNTGRLLNQDWIVDDYAYDTAEARTNTVTETEEETEEFFRSQNPTHTANCSGFFVVGVTPRVFGRFDTDYNGCIWDRTTTTTTSTTTHDIRLEERTLDVSAYKAGTPVTDPTGLSTETYTWAGCIEERDTVASDAINFAPTTGFTPAGLFDLDIDSTPTSDATRWRPYWPEIYVRRNNNTTLMTGSRTEAEGAWTRAMISGRFPQTACPSEAALLAEYSTVGDIRTYTNGLTPTGGTYHDIGLIWGARLASPDGLFQTNVTETPANLGFVGRNLIFMTDGDLRPNAGLVSAYGLERHDGRVTGNTTGASDADYDAALTARHTTRYRQMCEAIKAKGIRLWVVAFNTTLTADLTNCASTDSAFTADNAATLNAAFSSIAEQIAELRLTQ